MVKVKVPKEKLNAYVKLQRQKEKTNINFPCRGNPVSSTQIHEGKEVVLCDGSDL